MPETETVNQPEEFTTDTSAGDTKITAPEPTPEKAPEPPKAPEPEQCDLKAKGSFLNGKGVMTADGKCMDLERLQVVLIEQNGRTYEYSRTTVRN